MTTYQTLIQQLFSINASNGMKLGLRNIEALLSHLDNPHLLVPAIHVAGTNGKGSVCTMLAASLQKAGYKTGLYTSPHISCFRERIRINNEMISEEDICEHLQKVIKTFPATFFEYITACAFDFFAKQNVDFAVFETGIGGRLDATNVCRPHLSIITSISFDHTAILGDTLEKITEEKAGIIKPQVPVVVGPRVPIDIVKPIADNLKSPIFVADGNFSTFEEENRLIAKKSLEVLQKTIPLTCESIEYGLQALPPCRFEQVPVQKLQTLFGAKVPKAVILDVGHNPDGIEKVFSRIQKLYEKCPVICVYGMSKDKDAASCLKNIVDISQKAYFVAANSPRAQDPQQLALLATLLNPDFVSEPCSSVEEALSQGYQEACQKDAVLVILGTFFIMGQVRQFFGFNEPQDEMSLNERYATIKGRY